MTNNKYKYFIPADKRMVGYILRKILQNRKGGMMDKPEFRSWHLKIPEPLFNKFRSALMKQGITSLKFIEWAIEKFFEEGME